MEKSITINLVVDAIRPITQTPFSDRDTPKGKAKPISYMQMILAPEFLASRPATENGEDGDESSQAEAPRRTSTRVPVGTANGLRGILRREGANVVLSPLAAKGQKIPLHVLDFMRSGAGRSAYSVSGLSPAAAGIAAPAASFDDVLKGFIAGEPRKWCAEHNIHASIWGGGVSYVPSDLTVSDLVPITQETLHLISFAVSSDGLPSVRDLFAERTFVRKIDVLTACRHWLADEEVALLMAEMEQEKEQKKAAQSGESADEEKGERKEMRFMDRVQYIPAGTRFGGYMTLRNPTPAKIGLLIRTMEAWADDPYFGGYKRWGFGRVAVKGMVVGNPEKSFAFDKNGDFQAFGFDQELKAFDAWAANVTLADLDIYSHFAAEFAKREGAKVERKAAKAGKAS